MEYRRDILSYVNPEWESLSVLAVAFPVPPVPVHDLTYKVSSWNSNVLDDLVKASHSSSAVARMTPKGPAFAKSYKLTDLFNTRDRGNTIYPYPMYCASTSYTNSSIRCSGIASDARIDRISAISRSCHPGSHISVPGAPFLTTLLQMEHANGRGSPQSDFSFADDIIAENYFPTLDFSENVKVDTLFHYLTLTDLHVSASSLFGEKFNLTYLSSRLLNLVSGIVESNSVVFSGTPDLPKAMATIQKRNELIGGLSWQ